MFRKLLKAIVGDPNQRELDRKQPIVDEINALEPEMQAWTDEQLREQTRAFQARLHKAGGTIREQIERATEELDREMDADRRRALRLEINELRSELDSAERHVLDEILPRAFAAVREASVRTTGLRHFDVQLLGGLVLHENKIAEMRTGEGKTLVATLPLYLNALTGRGVHLVTPNDYLSKVGCQWMGSVYHLLGLSAAVIQSMGADPSMGSFIFDPDYVSVDDRYQHLSPCTRREAYQADITYGTNNEFGFDYLRDNMVGDLGECVQRELHYAIVDEVDNILIDEARTPLIISGAAEESTSHYTTFARLVDRFQPEQDYVLDEKQRIVTITEEGISRVEQALGIDNLYSDAHWELTPYLENALKAKALFARDRDYVISDDREIIIVDEFTGRLMHGRRYSEGLHQAIEAKENVPVQRESLTMATITFQNYFRMYRRLAGMTGTAVTESEEFSQIYDLEVVVIPTHRPLVRRDLPDVVYKTENVKFEAVFQEIKERHEAKQPVLVGTLAIETSEMISRRLSRMGITHEVLNAKQHEREAQIIAQAGRSGSVTIATNMAGRGVDILLGGNPEGIAREKLRRAGQDLQELDPDVWEEALAAATADCEKDRQVVLAAGGLHVLGTERYEARRIDNQLRGRAGRQGDPGSSRFYVALEDDIMRLFGGPAVARIMDRLGVDEDIPIEHDMVTKALANAQIRVEGHNFDLRKHIIEYDDVVNQQRQVIYDQRRLVLSEGNLRPVIEEILDDVLTDTVAAYTSAEDPDEWDLKSLHTTLDHIIHLPVSHSVATWKDMSAQEITKQVLELARRGYDERLQAPDMTPELMQHIQRAVMLSAIDRHWMRHLTALDELREGIGLRAFGQRNPLVEYKREAFDAFDMLLNNIRQEVAQRVLNVRVVQQRRVPRPIHLAGASGGSAGSMRGARRQSKVGRNSPCPCGSGRKYKNCCQREGLTAEQAAAKGAAQAREQKGSAATNTPTAARSASSASHNRSHKNRPARKR